MLLLTMSFSFLHFAVTQKGLVIPISLVSKSPSVVPNSVCKLLVSTSPSKAGSDKLLSTQTNKPVKMADLPTDLPLEDSSGVSEEDSSEMVVAEIKEFVEGLRVRNFLTTQQANLLNALLSSNRYSYLFRTEFSSPS